MSMEGEIVVTNFLLRSYTPVVRKSVSTLLAFEAHMSLFTGRPMRFA